MSFDGPRSAFDGGASIESYRELPIPRGYESHTSHQPPNLPRPVLSPTLHGLPSAISTGNSQAGANPNISRAAFLSAFETLYDQGEVAGRLQNQLRDQLRKTSTLLQTLQTSGHMIEGLVRGHFMEMNAQRSERIAKDMSDLSRRISVIEETLGITRSPELANNATPAASGKKSAHISPQPTAMNGQGPSYHQK